MKKIIAVGVLLLMASAAKFGFAEQSPYKFGYVDFQKTLNEVEEGKKAKAMLKSEFDEKQKNLDVVQTQLQAMKTDLDKQRLILSADTLKEKEDEFRKKFLDLQQKVASYEQELKNKEAALTSNILVVVHNIVKDIGEKEGYTMILEKSQDIVIYSPTNADLTDRVIKEYNGLSKDKKNALLKAK
ncbi:MAG: OmpH family outer membrane protein [Deltaproteobacteria bacterium]|nr:OmpH family outer membrane protein [Deltaproteobacteria bacterium]